MTDSEFERFRAGDPKYFREVLEKHHGFIMAMILNYRRDTAWVEARHQEACVAIWRKRTTLRKGRSFTAWAGRIARNICLMAIRSSEREERRIGHLEEVPPHQEPAVEEPDPLTQAERSQFRERVLEKLEELPPAQRRAFHLVHIEDYSPKEAAEVLDSKVATVRSNVRHAAKRLAQLLPEFRP